MYQERRIGSLVPCFRAYDIRGAVPAELDDELARRIAVAYAGVVQPAGPVAVGWDIRAESPGLAAAVVAGLNRSGVATHELGLCGTEVVYHAAAQLGMGGGIMVTASHNPKGQCGLKLVRRDPVAGVIRPLTGTDALAEMEVWVHDGREVRAARAETCRVDVWDSYLAQVLRFVDGMPLKPFRVLANAGNGCAGPVLDRLAPHLPFRFKRVLDEPDPTFPNGVPNPLLPENREQTLNAYEDFHPHFAVAWDGDFDRCFLFDAEGGFVEGYYIVGLLAQQMLRQQPGARIVHDPRLYWNTLDVVAAADSGAAVKCLTGHARIKQMMVDCDAVYGGEMSAHHYFRDFHYCDTGMVPWLLIGALLSTTDATLRRLVAGRMRKFPCSGEINRKVTDVPAVFRALLEHFAPEGPAADFFDGLSMTFGDRWRLNLRQSETEPENLRLNVESRGDRGLMEAKTEEVLAIEERWV